MTTHDVTAFEREVNGFLGLTIINLMFAGLAIGIGITIALTPLQEIFRGASITAPMALYLGSGLAVGAVGFVLGFLWIVMTAQMIDGVSAVLDALKPLKAGGNGDSLTGLFIRLMAFYRAKQATVTKMVLFGRVGGALFILAGVSNELAVLLRPFQVVDLAGPLVMVGVGLACLLITRSFVNYETVWERRLSESRRIEDNLREHLEPRGI